MEMPVFATRRRRIFYKKNQRRIDRWRSFGSWSSMPQEIIVESHIAETERVVFHIYVKGGLLPDNMMLITSSRISIKYHVVYGKSLLIYIYDGMVRCGLQCFSDSSEICGAVGELGTLVNVEKIAKSCGLLGG